MNEGLALAALPGEGVRGLRYERSPFGLRVHIFTPIDRTLGDRDTNPLDQSGEGRGGPTQQRGAPPLMLPSLSNEIQNLWVKKKEQNCEPDRISSIDP